MSAGNNESAEFKQDYPRPEGTNDSVKEEGTRVGTMVDTRNAAGGQEQAAPRDTMRDGS